MPSKLVAKTFQNFLAVIGGDGVMLSLACLLDSYWLSPFGGFLARDC